MDNNLNYHFLRAWGDFVAKGVIRLHPEDFKVVETLSFTPSGKGDHVYLFIEKTNANTDWVAAQLVLLTGLHQVDIGYAGLKDRHAVTQQWFSLHMPNQPEPDWSALPDAIQILSKTRHEKKLKTGAIQQNDFTLCIRNFQCDENLLEERLKIIQSKGIPNYFGPQRFGRNNANVSRFIATGGSKKRLKRQQRGILISAARSYLFNHILSRRILLNNWNQIIEGDVLMIDGSRSIFPSEIVDETLQKRLIELEIHPTAILWGRGQEMIKGAAAEISAEVISENSKITQALDKIGASLSHRAMRVAVKNMRWNLECDQLRISFSLVSGSYATSVLNEFMEIVDQNMIV